MRRIVVQWGDGTVNTLRHRPGVETAVGQQSHLPAGTYKLTHTYAAPPDRLPFEQVVLVRVDDSSGGVDFCIHKIVLTPRYRVTQYTTTLSIASNCDPGDWSNSEFDIALIVGQDVVATWPQWRPSQTLIPTSYVLEGSVVSRELTVADGLVTIKIDVVERDWLDDDEWSVTTFLSALSSNHSVSQVIESDGCKLRYSYDHEISLIAPAPSYGQVVVFAGDS